MWLKSCRLESCCWENNYLDRCLILAHFGGVFGSGGLDLECDGASIGNGDDSQKTGYQSYACNSCSSFGGFADAGDFDSAGGYDGFDGVDGGFDGFDGFNGDGASMESKETPMASLASVTPKARMALASLDFVASMVWVTDQSGRILCDVMLNFPPLKTWLTKQVCDAEGSRCSRRVDVAEVKKELMGSQIWSVVVTWAMMASMASTVASVASIISMASMVVSMALMDAPMASLASMAARTLMALASVALVVSRIWVTDLSRRKWSNEMLRFSPMENWLGSSTKQTWVDGRSRSTRRVGVLKMKKELMGSLIGVDGWRRWWTGVFDTECCVHSGEDDTHSSSLLFV